jgi:hypothetical protein
VRPARSRAAPAQHGEDLGEVPQAVIGGERSAVELCRNALADDRAQQDVLRAMSDAADEEARTTPHEYQPQGRQRKTDALNDDRDERDAGATDASSDEEPAERHPDRPRADQDAVTDVA